MREEVIFSAGSSELTVLFSGAENGEKEVVLVRENSLVGFYTHENITVEGSVGLDARVSGLEVRESYKYIQSSPSSSWAINHNLNKFPSVAIKDSAGESVFGEIIYNDYNNLTLNFSAPFSGEANLN